MKTRRNRNMKRARKTRQKRRRTLSKQRKPRLHKGGAYYPTDPFLRPNDPIEYMDFGERDHYTTKQLRPYAEAKAAVDEATGL